MNKDYCTSWFEGGWAHCCKAHDDVYFNGVDKVLADLALRSCVEATGAGLMWIGVFVFGSVIYCHSSHLFILV